MPSQDDGPSRQRRPRRATSAQTGDAVPDASTAPEADWAEWVAERDASAKKTSKKGDDGLVALSERDRWFLDQRPPHWG